MTHTSNSHYTAKALNELKALIKADELETLTIKAHGVQVYACDVTGNEYDVITKAERDVMTGRYYFITREGVRIAWSKIDPEKLITAAVDFLDAMQEEPTPAEEVENLDECTTAYHHTTAARVAHICQTIAEAVGVCYGSTLPAFDMAISLQQFGEWQTATTPDDEMNPAAPFFFAVRKQGTESGTREHCKERCRILGAPVYVIKVEREEAAGLFTLKVRVSSPTTREHVTHTAELAKTIGNEAAPRLAQFEDLKQKHPAALLIFSDDRAASYTCYNEDADRAAGALGLTINAAEGFRFVSFPAACLTAYLARLVRCGIRCAVCEPTGKPKPVEIVAPVTEADKSASWKTNYTAEDFQKLTTQNEVNEEDRDIIGRRFRFVNKYGDFFELQIFVQDYAGNEAHALYYIWDEFMQEVRAGVRSLGWLREKLTEANGWQVV